MKKAKVEAQTLLLCRNSLGEGQQLSGAARIHGTASPALQNSQVFGIDNGAGEPLAGECFVFDQRMALNYQLEQGGH